MSYQGSPREKLRGGVAVVGVKGDSNGKRTKLNWE